MLEAQAHSLLRYYLKETEADSPWKHHLTMTRMVARGLRLKRSTIIQTGVTHERSELSYLVPALLSDAPVIIVTNKNKQEILLREKIPQLQTSLNSDRYISNNKAIITQKKSFLLILDYSTWLDLFFAQRLAQNIITIITEAEQLPNIIKDYLTETITSSQLFQLISEETINQDIIRDKLAKLTKLIYDHPPNPYNSYLLEEAEIELIKSLATLYQESNHQQLKQFLTKLLSNQSYVSYFTIDRSRSVFKLKVYPLELKSSLSHLWNNQNLIFISNYLEPEKYPRDYSEELGFKLDNFTCLKFTPSAHKQALKLYFINSLPFPNSPHFFPQVHQEILALVGAIKINHNPIVIIIDDLPLQGQITASLASNFGSRVQLQRTDITDNTILVCDIKFWLKNQTILPPPQLVIMPTLPIPSLENPLISAQVTYYKKRKKDWFRLFLLPSTIKILQQATVSVREHEGVLAVLDNRINYRSYGTRILEALEPYAKINYLDLDWLN